MALVMADILSSTNNVVRLWGPLEQHSGLLRRTRQDATRLPDFFLNQKIEVFQDSQKALKDSNLIVSAIPTVYVRELWNKLAPMISRESIIFY